MTALPSDDLTTLSNDALVLLFGRGEGAAAGILIARLGPKVLGVATRMLKGDRADAEDIVQEAFLRLWKRAPDWDAGGAAQVGTWLCHVASNLCIDRLRKSRRNAPLEDAAEPADPAPSADARLQAGERMAALDAALATLPERQREAVILRHIEGFANPEIAAVMEISVEAVESLVARGKRALTLALAPQREELSHGE